MSWRKRHGRVIETSRESKAGATPENARPRLERALDGLQAALASGK